MKIKFDTTNQPQMELIKAMGSDKRTVSEAAQESFAELLSPIVSEQYAVAGTSQIFYKDFNYTKGDSPTIALDLLAAKDETWLSVWTQYMPGGAPTNTVTVPLEEFPLLPYRLDSAVSYLKKWAAKSRVDVVARVIERLFQEILLRSEDNLYYVALAALVGSTNPQTTNLGNLRRSNTINSFTLDDLNKLFTVFRRTSASWAGTSTLDTNIARPTDLIMSPEMFERIRSFSYQPVNTVGGNFTAITANSQTSASAAVPLPESERSALFNAAGTPNFFGTNITVINELGVGQRYTSLFASLVGSTAYPVLTGSATDTFDLTADDLIIAVDARKEFAMKGLATDGAGSTLTLQMDDQFIKRSEKLGLYGSVEMAPFISETRGIFGLIV